ncbi:MAG: transcription termination factor NusA [Gammaproteobacteria bacterium WSBS_2016_MAG_OTU1]
MAIGGGDLLMYIQSISREKDLPFEQVLEIFAESMAQSARRGGKDVQEGEFRVEINNENGEVEAWRMWRVLDEEELMENPQGEMMLESAQEKRADAQPGEMVEEPYDSDLLKHRSCVHSAKQHFTLRLREADRRRLLDEILARNEKLVSGQVLRVLRDTGDVIVEVMRLECRLPRNQMIPRETLKPGDRVQAYIKEVNVEGGGHPVVLSRTSPEFLKLLCQRVVPEIEKGVLEIIDAVRDPGNRAKISVRTHDQRVDPVGTCVGIRGSRVQTVTNELNGERVDVIQWFEDQARFILEALKPAEVQRISMDKSNEVNVLVEPERMAQAIGKNGVNVRLASEITGCKLNLRTVGEFEAEEEENMQKKSAIFAQALNLQEDMARILLEEGFDTFEHVAYGDENELLEIAGFQLDAVREIQSRAREQVAKDEAELEEKMAQQEENLVEFVSENEDLRRALAKHDILTLQDFADLATDELLEMIEMAHDEAGEYIIRARDVLDPEEEEAK